MERVRRLAQLWSWLPAFRAVAELEHLPSAAEELHVSASALSRSVRMLEEAAGVQLFERQGRRIMLNDAGREFLVVVRSAMRMLDDGLESITSRTVTGSIRISAPGPFASLWVLPAIARMRAEHPGLVPEVLPMSAELSGAALLAGKLDLALLDDPVPRPHLRVDRLVDVGYGVYCGEGHPLFGREDVTEEDVLAHPFAAPPEGEDDHWPPDVPRQIGVRLSQLQLGVELCAAGACLAVLPNPVATKWTGPGRLTRLPFEGFAPTALYAVYREPLGTTSKTDLALAAVRAEIGYPEPSR